MTSKFLFQGAEATLSSNENSVIKERKAKTYRLPELDNRLRKLRTRKEIKLLEKSSSLIDVPKILSFTEYNIVLEKINGKNLASELDSLSNKKDIAKQIGHSLAKLHDSGIIHGDLTTSNIIYSNKKLYFIDFGLGFESDNVEDKAVDLHVLKEALEARHHKYAKIIFESILIGYKSSKSSSLVLKRLEAVEKRGRYKQAY